MGSMHDGSAKPRKRRPKSVGKVIYVAFGDGGGRIHDQELREAARAAVRSQVEPTPTPPVDDTLDVFSRREASRLLKLSEARLRSLDRRRIVVPSAQRKGRPAYTFQDLIALRVTRDLLAKRVTLSAVERAVVKLRETLPRVTRPLHELRIVSDGKKLLVRSDFGTFDPNSGQLVLDFEVRGLRDDVVRVLRPQALERRRRTAADLYLQASVLDENPETYEEAATLYADAIALDPTLAIAHTNLGNVRFRQGRVEDAEAHYRKALSLDPSQAEASYNVGYVLLERNEHRDAIGFFQVAVAADPKFADAHFNLALAFEEVGDRPRARTHWQRYLDIEPTGTWAAIALRHLD